MMIRYDQETASVSGLFVCSVMGLVSLAALTFDGGRVIDTYAEMSSVAASAARVGGQEVEGIRENSVKVNANAARAAMNRYLDGRGYEVVLEVDTTKIRVSLSKNVLTPWLGTFGIGSRSIAVTRSVEIVAG